MHRPRASFLPGLPRRSSPVPELLLALLLWPALAKPAGVYRSVDSQGQVTYSDHPVPGAVENTPVDILPQPALSPDGSGSERARALIDAANAAGARRAERSDRRAALQAEVDQSRAELEAARTALTEGRKPQAGDYLGAGGGRAWLSEGYGERVEQLQGKVAEAERAVEEAEARLAAEPAP